MNGYYSPSLVALSVAIATLASYAALKLAKRVARLTASLQIAKDQADAAIRENERLAGELHSARSELLASARQAGAAVIATNVLHNVGNVLNSVNVSADLIATRVRNSKLESLAQSVQLMNEHAADLGSFLAHDSRGQRLLGFMNKLHAVLAETRAAVTQELAALTKSVDHVREIVSAQQTHAGAAPSLSDPVHVGDLISDALLMGTGSITRYPIDIVREIAEIPPILLDKHLVLQILINLISNAKQAMYAIPDSRHQLTLRVDATGAPGQLRLRMAVQDNGEGISEENLRKLFVHGFTTRKTGHGFGLHGAALAARSLGGALTAHSDGLGKGATFVLELPMRPAAAVA